LCSFSTNSPTKRSCSLDVSMLITTSPVYSPPPVFPRDRQLVTSLSTSGRARRRVSTAFAPERAETLDSFDTKFLIWFAYRYLDSSPDRDARVGCTITKVPWKGVTLRSLGYNLSWSERNCRKKKKSKDSRWRNFGRRALCNLVQNDKKRWKNTQTNGTWSNAFKTHMCAKQ
jgi:hypothetical protein